VWWDFYSSGGHVVIQASGPGFQGASMKIFCHNRGVLHELCWRIMNRLENLNIAPTQGDDSDDRAAKRLYCVDSWDLKAEDDCPGRLIMLTGSVEKPQPVYDEADIYVSHLEDAVCAFLGADFRLQTLFRKEGY